MILVLVTSGEGEVVNTVKVLTFLSQTTVSEFVKAINENQKGKKYWRHAQVIEEGQTYEISETETFPV
jgi:hypothetical protein